MKYLGAAWKYDTTASLIITLRRVYDKTCDNIFYVVFHRERHFESLYSSGVSLSTSEIEAVRQERKLRLAALENKSLLLNTEN